MPLTHLPTGIWLRGNALGERKMCDTCEKELGGAGILLGDWGGQRRFGGGQPVRR